MKKLIIAAGIAAATMASFGASAKDYTSSASVNTVVTGTTGFVVSSADKTMDAETFKADGTVLGVFNVTAPDGATKFTLSGIHAHNYPTGYKVKIGSGSCEATLDTNGSDAAFGNGGACDVTITPHVVQDLEVKNYGGFVGDVAPGVRTLTVNFTSTVN